MAQHLAFALARRELRGGIRGFRIFILCVTLGVSVIAGVGSLSNALVDGLRQDGRKLIGGDVELERRGVVWQQPVVFAAAAVPG